MKAMPSAMTLSFRAWIIFFFTAFAVLLGSPRGFAQTTATISGAVTDQSGGAIPRAQIAITNLDTGQSRTLEADDMGRYYAPALNPGRYKVSAAAQGFDRAIQSEITLTVGFEQVINFSLHPGQVSQTIEVTGEPPVVQTTSSNVAALVNSQTVRALPLNGRSFDQLIYLQPGVNVATSAGGSPNQGRGVKFSVGGARLTSNVFMLDGTDMNDAQNFTPGGAGGQLLGIESILEFQVITHNATAQYGRSMGGIINAVSKSGTNALHGSMYEFLRNSVLDAKNYFDDPDKPIPAFRRNQFGASAGGAIRRDHLFYFANYEGLRESLGVTKGGLVPDANARRGILPGLLPGETVLVPVDPRVKPYLDLYPPPNGPNIGGGVAKFFLSQKQPTRGDYGNTRLDWNMNEKNSFFGRYTMDDSSKLRQEATDHVLGLFAEDETHRNQYFTLGATQLIRPSVLNVARFGFNRSTTLVNLVNQADVSPSLSLIPGQPFGRIIVRGISPLGATINDPRYFRMNSFQPSDDLSITRGAHALKTGFIVERFQWNTANFNRIGGDYDFVSLAAFLQGTVDSVRAPFPGSEPNRGIRALLFGTYFQDDYRFSRRLTLNLGLRYEITTVPTEVNGKMSFMPDPSGTALVNQQPYAGNHLNFAPRFGFAWDPKGDGKTAVRGGAGIYYDQIVLNQFLNMFDRNPPQWLTVTLRGSAARFPNPLSGTIAALGPNFAFAKPPFTLQNAVFNDFKTPYSYHYNLTVQREIARQFVVSVGYVGSTGRHLIARSDGNTPIPIVLPGGRPCNPGAVSVTNPVLPAGTLCTPLIRIPDPEDDDKFTLVSSPRRNRAWGELQTRRLSGFSYYNSLQVLVSRRFARGLQVHGTYTYSRSIDTSAGLFSEEADNAATGIQIPDRPFNERGLSNFDIRHRAVFNFLYELPFGKNLQGFARQALDGWEIGSIATFATGVPFTVENRANRSQNGAVGANFSDRPNLVSGASNNPTHGVSRGCARLPAGTPVGTPTLYFDPCAFTPQVLGTFGNLGRNTLIGPGFSDVDFLVNKHFRRTERSELQFRAEFFNILNRPNFQAPTVETRRIFAGDSTSPIVTDPPTPPRFPAPSSSAGHLLRTTTTSRQIQFGLKFVF